MRNLLLALLFFGACAGDETGPFVVLDSVCVTDCTTTDGNPRGLCSGPGEFCIDTQCRVPFTMVSVSSNTTPADVFSASSPGPDVDAIEIIRSGRSIWAQTVEASQIGEVAGAGVGTNCEDPAAAIGTPRSIPTNAQDGECALSGESAEGRLRYFCLGGGATNPGYITVSFGNDFYLMDGDQIRVWELSPVGTAGSEFGCSNTTAARNDGYSVFAGKMSTNLAPVGNANFIELGATGDQGGVFRFTFDDPGFSERVAICPSTPTLLHSWTELPETSQESSQDTLRIHP